jgi:hypothetical protein
MRTRRAVVVFSLGALFTLGCKGITTPSSNQNEPFSGTLQVKGSNTHVFNVSRTGEFTAKLTAWAPNSNILAGMALTSANNDSSCTTLLQRNDFVVLNGQGLSSQIFSGKYCIVVFDPSTMTAPQTYTVTVSHP